MSRELCDDCGTVVDPNFDAHEFWDDDQRRLLWYCERCCPLCDLSLDGDDDDD